MTVAVGSTNPTKINSAQEVFQFYYSDVNVLSADVDPKVSSQPKSEDEMYQGALNRAKGALKIIKKAQYGVGIEGGIHKYSYGWFERSLVVIVDRLGDIGIGSSGGLRLPNRVVDLISNGKTLEEAVDELFGTTKIGRSVGMFGLFTNNFVTRTEGVKHGVAFALARFLHKDIYSQFD